MSERNRTPDGLFGQIYRSAAKRRTRGAPAERRTRRRSAGHALSPTVAGSWNVLNPLQISLFDTSTTTQGYTLADIERGFRVLKSDLEIAPVFHRLPDRIRAHALICFLALVMYRVMESAGHALLRTFGHALLAD